MANLIFSAVPRSIPTIVRTKKAENRITATSPLPSDSGEPLNPVEQRALEHQKRQEWRQARLILLHYFSNEPEYHF